MIIFSAGAIGTTLAPQYGVPHYGGKAITRGPARGLLLGLDIPRKGCIEARGFLRGLYCKKVFLRILDCMGLNLITAGGVRPGRLHTAP
jgi:hypothetical protein